MPELPEVETVVRALRAPLIGHSVQSVWYDWTNMLQGTPPHDFDVRLRGQTFRAVNRRAKYILLELDHDVLLVHLKMTGRLYVVDDDTHDHADTWLHFRAQLDGGKQLRFSDARKFGKVILTDNPDSVLGKLGPEPLADDFTATDFAARLSGRHKLIKPLLLDQTFIAGVGNIYADEALYSAQIHPQRPSDSITPDESERLYHAVRAALFKGIEQQGASVNWYRKPDGTPGAMQDHFHAYDREGEPCERCGSAIIKVWVGQRGTHYCPTCQQV